MFRKLLGLYIIVIGILLFLSNAFDIDVTWNYFGPSLLLLIGLTGLIERKGRSLFFLIVTLLGITTLISAIGLVEEDVYQIVLGPAIIIIIGVRLLLTSRFNKVKSSSEKSYTSIFGGVEEKNIDKDFEKCEITSVFGSAKLDFRGIKLKNDKAYIDVVSIFGGCELILPREYKITFNGTPIFGGMDDKLLENNPDAEKEIIVNYTVIFGGIDVRN